MGYHTSAVVVVLLVLGPGCGGQSSSPSPSPTPPIPPQPTAWTVSGRVTQTLAGSGVARAHVDAFIASADADADGRFTLTATPGPTSSQALTVSADGYRPRETVMRLPRTDDVLVDLMSTAPPFDETFYNQLARDALDEPASDYPLYRWSAPLKFYLATKDEYGRPLSEDILEVIRRGIRQSVHYYTAGTYEAAIEEGPGTRPEQVGWVNVLPRQVIPEGDYCGYASSVGGNPSTVQLRIDRCGCGSTKVPIELVIHEVGHVVGMFHVSGKQHVMHKQIDSGCREVVPSAVEQYHASLMYARPRGNRSPDRDPGEFMLGRPGGGWEGAPGRP